MELGSINWYQVMNLTPASLLLTVPVRTTTSLASFSDGWGMGPSIVCVVPSKIEGNGIWLRRILYFSDTLVVYQDSREVPQDLVGRSLSKARLVGGCGWMWMSFTVKDLEISKVRITCGAWTHPVSVLTKLIPPPFACWVCHILGSSTLMPLPFKCSSRNTTWNLLLA